jgi:DNA-binding MarR family transcriptional regulator
MTQTATSAAPAGPAALGRCRVLIIIGAQLLGMRLAALDQTIVATALPTIAGDLHGLSHLSWVVTAYLLAPTARDTSQEMERDITSLLSRERRRAVYTDLLTAAGLQLRPRAGWLLYRVGEHHELSRDELAELLQVPDTDLQHWLAELTPGGYVTDGDTSQPVRLTAAGRAAHQDLLRARGDRLRRLCADWDPDRHPQLAALLTTITHQLAASGEKPGADLDAA